MVPQMVLLLSFFALSKQKVHRSRLPCKEDCMVKTAMQRRLHDQDCHEKKTAWSRLPCKEDYSIWSGLPCKENYMARTAMYRRLYGQDCHV